MNSINGYGRAQSCKSCVHFDNGFGWARKPFCRRDAPLPPQGYDADALEWMRAVLRYVADRTVEHDGWCPEHMPNPLIAPFDSSTERNQTNP